MSRRSDVISLQMHPTWAATPELRHRLFYTQTGVSLLVQPKQVNPHMPALVILKYNITLANNV